jgi:mannose-1-phosphate guanylyltransferase
VVEEAYAVIMAGGGGTRLWPRSRQATPKQFLDLLGPRTMLQETVDRIEPLIPLERVLVVTGHEYANDVLALLPGLPPENVVREPQGRGTAPCIGLAALALQQRDPEAIMAVFPADHQVARGSAFRQAVAAAVEVARQDYLVTLGITPTHAHTGYGYVQRGQSLPLAGETPVYTVRQFTEKPDADTARRFVECGEYAWNAGIFVWRVRAILDEIGRLLPALHTVLTTAAEAWDTPDRQQVLSTVWQQTPRTTIDYGVMEKANRVAVIPIEVGWDDVGNWSTLSQLLQDDGDGNVTSGPGQHVLVDTHDAYIYAAAGRLVATIGLDELVVVDTEDAVLVCPKDRAQDVREIVDRLKARGLDRYL